jgi:Bacterial Ig-like domain
MGNKGMGNTLVRTVSTLVLLGITTGCGGAGGSSGTRGGGRPKGPLPATLSVLTHWPEAESTRAPRNVALAIQFDAPLQPACITDGQTYLEERDTGKRIDTKITLIDGNASVQLKPVRPLGAQTWYTCHLSPLLCDLRERLLEEDRFFSFRTVDIVAPRLTSASVTNGAKGVAKNIALRLEFDEPIDPTSASARDVYVRDARGKDHAIDPTIVGKTLHVKLVRDLLPLHRYTLRVTGIRDLAGNALASAVGRTFTTADDLGPRVLKVDPTTGSASPNTHVFLHFDSSVDVATIAAGPVRMFDVDGAAVAFDVHAEPSHRILRLVPRQALRQGERYSVSVGRGIKNPGGKALRNSSNTSFVVGTDATPPKLLETSPKNDSNRISVLVAPSFDFDELLDQTRLNNETIELRGEDGPLPFVVTTGANSARLFITPVAPLESGRKHTLTLLGGPLGLRDRAGNFLPADIVTVFYTSTDRTAPVMTISPTHGHSAVSKNSTFTAAFDDPLDPASVNSATVIVTNDTNQVISGTLTLSGNNRIITFDPDKLYTPDVWYTVTLRAGANGIQERSGNWLQKAVRTSFRVAYALDTTPPDVTVTVNGIANRRKAGLAVPKSGFELSILADDPSNYDVDLGSFEAEITGPAVGIDSDQILAGGTITKKGLGFVVALNQAFKPGAYTFRARVADMAGNVGVSAPLEFRVVESDSSVMPFERTQVVYVRFDLDRDGNRRADFVDDLFRLGLATEGDPNGTNQRMIDIMRDGVLAQTHAIYERKKNGGRKPEGSIPVLFTATRPRGVRYSEMAFGGLDPAARAGRKYSEKSSGILGRAYFDRNNASRSDRNIGTNPGLGVFGGELFLFEVETHLSLYPSFVTTFARRFMKVVPEMGGTSAGNHPLDRQVLAREFDLNNASPQAMRRYFDIFLALDDWASATAVILAHETGHTVGLVATGAPPTGLHGDRSLHNRYPRLGNVMSSAVGYESLVNLSYRFRDLNAAYLRQRILLK